MTILIASVLLCGAAILRLLPVRLAKGVLGSDHWYWKSYVEEYRGTKRLPPRLPQFLLDQHHWYPPVFPLLIAAVPDHVFNRYSQLVAVVIDICRMALVLATSFWITGGSVTSVVTTGLLYATSPILISYNAQLNPRGLGALFLDSILCLLLWIGFQGGGLTLWSLLALLAGVMLLTHKMTTQLFWFLCVSLSLVLQAWQMALLIPVSIAAAMILSRGFYGNVLMAHWDIVTFWNRNWRWLQAHPIKESPIYGEPGYETPTRFYRKGLNGFARHLQYLVGFNPAAWILVPAGAAVALSSSGASIHFAVLWATLILVFSMLTLIVPFMRCLGSGYFYLYNAAFPVSLIGGWLIQEQPRLGWIVWVAAIANAAAVAAYYRTVTATKRSQDDGPFGQVLEFLKAAPRGNIMCLPLQWSDIVAYKTGQPVLTGAHGYGLKLFEPLFPRLLLPIHEVMRTFQVRYLVTTDSYMTERVLRDLPPLDEKRFGEYHVYVTRL